MRGKNTWIKVGKFLLVIFAFFAGTLVAKTVFSLFMEHR